MWTGCQNIFPCIHTYICCVSGLTKADFQGKNVVIFLSDQERDLMYFPEGWEEKYMPATTELKKYGVRFKRAFSNSCMCSPARAALLSGYFPAQSGVRFVLEQTMPDTEYYNVEMPTPDSLKNMASAMSAAGFKVVYKGKMHIAKPDDPDYIWKPQDAAKYGFERWNPPDAGANASLSEAGDSPAFNDDRIIEQVGDWEIGEEGALQYIREAAGKQQPFFLIVSVVNPHDVLFYPLTYGDAYNTTEPLLPQDPPIELPPTWNESYATKPKCQASFQALMQAGLGAITTDEQRLEYLNFYGYLLSLADSYLGKVIKELKDAALFDDTIIIKTSDHGAMAMTHGTQRQKMFNMYEETMRVPLIFSNPKLYPQSVETDAMVSHVDLVPTFVSLFGSTLENEWPGVDYSSILLDPKGQTGVQDYVLFSFDDVLGGQPTGVPLVPPPNHIVGIREERYKLAKYYDPNQEETKIKSVYEMYDLLSDPSETQNLAFGRRTDEEEFQFLRLRRKLNAVVKDRFQAIPIERNFDLYGTTINVQRNATVFIDEGNVTGRPIGEGTIRLTFKLDPKNDAASVSFKIFSYSGAIRGRGTMSYTADIKSNNITFIGSSILTSGTSAYAGIKTDTPLYFSDTNNLEGTEGRVRLSGMAFF